MNKYDVIVIGGGHAGVEAAVAAARRGAKTLLMTRAESDLGAMSCNPSVGGPGKSQMVAEIAALGGIMPHAADAAGIHFRVLNATHGPATRALRIQIDRDKYHKSITCHMSHITNLDIKFEPVESLDLQNKTVNGKYSASAIVITTGTFLRGLVHRGPEKIESGRLQDDGTYQSPDTNISDVLRAAGFNLLRLKTGTPARILADSVDFTKCEVQPGDAQFGDKNRVNCYITHTTAETHKIIRDNIASAPMYNGDIVGTGPRYCPSVEDKVMRFPEHETHHVFLEPETADGKIIYPNGISTSMPA
ncbi:MAG: tRNA uridine-5-carboxymethylaminomethyl(34) synthesis enzyme MnmG, partial [Rickettsiales bacterium]|nr:tRNA uridine-5-carboxymethylaminomethyl(34) synthesis enzyme MnmG [Rickettsiales bacterium]